MTAAARRALSIGINDYTGTHNDLSGCVSDVDGWTAALGKRGLEVDQLLNRQATGRAIRDATKSPVLSARPRR
jgi:hypothetical protein